MERTTQEIEDVINACMQSEKAGRSSWPGMTYEQGVLAALRWVTDAEEINPLED